MNQPATPQLRVSCQACNRTGAPANIPLRFTVTRSGEITGNYVCPECADEWGQGEGAAGLALLEENTAFERALAIAAQAAENQVHSMLTRAKKIAIWESDGRLNSPLTPDGHGECATCGRLHDGVDSSPEGCVCEDGQ